MQKGCAVQFGAHIIISMFASLYSEHVLLFSKCLDTACLTGYHNTFVEIGACATLQENTENFFSPIQSIHFSEKVRHKTNCSNFILLLFTSSEHMKNFHTITNTDP